MANIRLIGLADDTQRNLIRVLESHHHTVAEPADAVFCGPLELLPSTADAPVIVVTSSPHLSEWLDALDHGAANYCSEPLEEAEVLFTLASVLHALA